MTSVDRRMDIPWKYDKIYNRIRSYKYFKPWREYWITNIGAAGLAYFLAAFKYNRVFKRKFLHIIDLEILRCK